MKFLLFCVIILKIITISYNPLAWFDEVFFASMSENFWQKGTFHTPIVVFEEEVKIYGFFYFLYTGFLPYIFQDIFGFSHTPFYFRIGNLCSGIIFLFIFYKLLRIYLYFPKKYALFLTFLLSIDPFFNLCWHEGRMDLTALCFGYIFLFFLQIFFLPNNSEKNIKKRFLYLFFCAVCVALALCTTPRMALFFVAFGLVGFFFGNFQQKFIWFLIVIKAFLLYYIWIFWKFDGIYDFLNYYKEGGKLAHQSPFSEHYLGGRGYIPKHEYLIIFLTIFFAVFYFLHRIQNFYKNPTQTKPPALKGETPRGEGLLVPPLGVRGLLLLGGGINIIFFYLFVFDYGQYSIYILGFYYILFGFFVYELSLINFKNNFLVEKFFQKKYILGFLLVFNAFFFLGKNLQIFSDMARKNPQIANEFIAKNIPKNARVIGDATYYYALHNQKKAKNVRFQLIDNFEILENRERLQRQKFQYTHVIVTDMLRKKRPELLDFYEKKAKEQGKSWKKIAKLYLPTPIIHEKIGQFFRISQMENPAYNAEIFEVKAPQPPKGE